MKTEIAFIAPEFGFVADRGLALVDFMYSPESFGNAALVLAGDPLSIRLIRDRSIVSVEVGRLGRDPYGHDGWYYLQEVFAYLASSGGHVQGDALVSLERLAAQLKERWSEVVGLFSSPTSSQSLARFVAAARRAGRPVS